MAGEHSTKYLLNTFQDLACNESRHRAVVVSGVGAGVGADARVSCKQSPKAYGQTTEQVFYHEQSDGYAPLQIHVLIVLSPFEKSSSHWL